MEEGKGLYRPSAGPRDRIDVGLVRYTRGAISVQDS